MARAGADLATMRAKHAVTYEELSIKNASGAWVDLTALFNSNHLLRGQVTEGLDSVVSEASFTLRRDTNRRSDGVRVSLAPLVTTSPANSGGPLIDYERSIRLRTATVAPNTARPAAGSGLWHTVFLGLVSEFSDALDGDEDPNELTIRAVGEMARLGFAFVKRPTVYGTKEGRAVQSVMEDIRAAWGPWLPTIVTPTDPLWQVKEFEQEPESLMTVLRDKLALQIGFDFRYRFIGEDYRPVFQAPVRVGATAALVYGANEYHAVPAHGGSNEETRNVVEVSYYDEEEKKVVTVEARNEASINRFGGAGVGERYMHIALDDKSNIRKAADALRLAGAAVNDLAFPLVSTTIETFYTWHIEIGDYLAFAPNDYLWTDPQAFGLVGFTHNFDNGDATTTLLVRGLPAAAYRTWQDVYASGGATEPEELRFVNFREIKRTDTHVTLAWDGYLPEDGAAEVWDFETLATLPMPPGAKDPWPEEETPYTRRYTPDTREVVVEIPPKGKGLYYAIQPMTPELKPGKQEHVQIFAVNEPPRITNFTQVRGASDLFATISVDVVDPQALGGVLKAWLNHDAPDNASSSGAPDGTLVIASTPEVVNFTDVFSTPGGPGTLMANVRTHAGKGKTVAFEFTNSKGTSSGIVTFEIRPGTPIINAQGDIIDSGINNWRQLADGLQFVLALPEPLPIPNDYPVGQKATIVGDALKTLYTWNGTAWIPEVAFSRIFGQAAPGQLQDQILRAEHFGNGVGAVGFIDTVDDVLPEGVVAAVGPTGQLHFIDEVTGKWSKKVEAPDIAGQLASAQLAVGSVTGAIIAAGAITAPNVAIGAITATAIAPGAVTTPKLAAGAVTAATIAAGAVIAENIAAGAVQAVSIAAGAVTTAALAAGSVIAAKIQAGAVTATAIAAGAITATAIQAGAVTANALAANSVIAAKIAAGAITATHISAGAITATALAANSVTATAIQAGAVKAGAIDAKAVKAVHLEIEVLSDIKKADGTSVGGGIILGARINGIDGQSYLDLNVPAGSGLSVFHHPLFDLRGNGTGEFRGPLIGNRFNNTNNSYYLDFTGTGASLNIPGLFVAAGAATFTGTVGSTSFTAATANFNNIDCETIFGTSIVLSFGSFDLGPIRGNAFLAQPTRLGFHNTSPISKPFIGGGGVSEGTLIRQVAQMLHDYGLATYTPI
jgi:hypothetical protein